MSPFRWNPKWVVAPGGSGPSKPRCEMGTVPSCQGLSPTLSGPYRRRLREEQGGRVPGKAGRRRLTPSLRELIVRLAKENTGWGVRRIVGELQKLALKASRSSVRRVLVDEKILPDPDRRAPEGVPTPWRKFIAIHMNVMVACDFFSKTVWTPLGRQTAFVLAFVHLGSRKVFVSPSTLHPTDAWVRQQARNASMWADDEGIDVRFLTRSITPSFASNVLLSL